MTLAKAKARHRPNRTPATKGSPRPGRKFAPADSCSSVVVCSTELGSMAAVFSDFGLAAVLVGHHDEEGLWAVLRRDYADARFRDSAPVADLLEGYARGESVDFTDVELDVRHLTPFRVRVMGACRSIEYGRTMTYAGLAASAGSPNAYRAVGSTMASNRWPLVVPCHRVVRSDGGLGGYSTPRGVALKKTLLALEAGANDRRRGGKGSADGTARRRSV